jgi:hypothetical protein
MLRETKKPISQRHALMQKVSRAVIEQWRSEPPASVVARGAEAATS